jgi:hypothetical protein
MLRCSRRSAPRTAGNERLRVDVHEAPERGVKPLFRQSQTSCGGSDHSKGDRPSHTRYENFCRDVFGVQHDGNTVHIIDQNKFLNWSFLPALTRNCVSTVFARVGLHVQVLAYLVAGNVAFFVLTSMYEKGTDYKEDLLPSQAGWVTDSVSWGRSLVTFLAGGYASLAINLYFASAQNIGTNLIKTVDSIVAQFDAASNYANDQTQELALQLYDSIIVMVSFAFAVVMRGKKYELSGEEERDIFKDHGFDVDTLDLKHPIHAINTLKHATIGTIVDEMRKENPCIDASAQGPLVQGLLDLATHSTELLPTANAKKMPYSYVSLLQWIARVTDFFWTIFLFLDAAAENVATNARLPFTCFEFEVAPDSDSLCPTALWIWQNSYIACSLYAVFGVYELTFVLERVWETELVADNYVMHIQWAAYPLRNRELCARLNDLRKESGNGP